MIGSERITKRLSCSTCARTPRDIPDCKGDEKLEGQSLIGIPVRSVGAEFPNGAGKDVAGILTHHFVDVIAGAVDMSGHLNADLRQSIRQNRLVLFNYIS